jgi:Secretion system C-terminal sorting domain
LGVQYDQNAINWYSVSSMDVTNEPAWVGPYNAWFMSTYYNLTMLANNPDPVQFRFVFDSDNFPSSFTNDVDGWGIDDFQLSRLVGVEEIAADEGILLSGFPNPANSNVTINYIIPKAGQLNLVLRNMLGQEIIVYNDDKQAGSYQWNIDVTELPNGIYFYELNYRIVKRLVVNH